MKPLDAVAMEKCMGASPDGYRACGKKDGSTNPTVLTCKFVGWQHLQEWLCSMQPGNPPHWHMCIVVALGQHLSQHPLVTSTENVPPCDSTQRPSAFSQRRSTMTLGSASTGRNV